MRHTSIRSFLKKIQFFKGDIILNSGEVRSNWLDFIRNIEKNEKPLKRVPALEAALSRYICDIKVSQRVFRPKLLAEYYECHLRVLTTSLGIIFQQQ